MSGPEESKNSRTGSVNKQTNLSEHYQFIIAIVVIVSLIVFLAILYNNKSFDYAEKMIATFGAFVGTIIGYFFGQRPVQNLQNQVVAAIEQKKEIEDAVKNAEAEDTLEKSRKELERLTAKNKEYERIVGQLKAELENLKNSDDGENK